MQVHQQPRAVGAVDRRKAVARQRADEHRWRERALDAHLQSSVHAAVADPRDRLLGINVDRSADHYRDLGVQHDPTGLDPLVRALQLRARDLRPPRHDVIALEHVAAHADDSAQRIAAEHLASEGDEPVAQEVQQRDPAQGHGWQ